jgi:hypothetical protein
LTDFRNNSTASGSSTRLDISNAATAGSSPSAVRIYTTASDWSIGSRRSTRSLDFEPAGALGSVTPALSLNYENNTATFAGKVTTSASTTTRASLNIPSGTAPTTPVNGDIWSDGNNLLIRLAGVTYTIQKL